MPQNQHEVAAKAMEVATVAKTTAESLVREMRERFDRQDEESRDFRDKLMREIQAQNRVFDRFKTDFEAEMDKIDRRCIGHNEALFGNKDKNITGICEKVESHDGDIRKGKWTVWLCGVLISWAVIYVVYFYGDAMKRGIFNPTEQEWGWRVTRVIKKTVKPEALRVEGEHETVNN